MTAKHSVLKIVLIRKETVPMTFMLQNRFPTAKGDLKFYHNWCVNSVVFFLIPVKPLLLGGDSF